MLCFRCDGEVDGRKFCPHCGLRQSPPEKQPEAGVDRDIVRGSKRIDILRLHPPISLPTTLSMAQPGKKFSANTIEADRLQKPNKFWIKRQPAQKLVIAIALVFLLCFSLVMLLKWPGRETKQKLKSLPAELRRLDRSTKQVVQMTKQADRTNGQILRTLPLKHKELDRTRKTPARPAPSQGEASTRPTKTSGQTAETSQQEALRQIKSATRKSRTLTPDPRPSQTEGDRISRDLDPVEHLDIEDWIKQWLVTGDFSDREAGELSSELIGELTDEIF